MSRPLALRLTEAAEADLAEIWVSLATEASEQVATRFVAAHFEPLCHFPLSGSKREQLAPGLRVTFQSPYAIYYRPQPDALVIIRVIHGTRDLAALTQRSGFA